MCRLRISALGAHIPTCQALDLPTEFNPRDAPTLVSGLPRAISGLLQFAVLLPQTRREGCTHSPGREASHSLPAAPQIPVWHPSGSQPHSRETPSRQFSTQILMFLLTLLPLLFSQFHFGYSSLSFDPLPPLPLTCPLCSTTTPADEG